MDDFMKLEAKEIISTGVEKSIVAGVMNIEVSYKKAIWTSLVCLQIREGEHG